MGMYLILYIIMYVMENNDVAKKRWEPRYPGDEFGLYWMEMRTVPVSDMDDASKISELAEKGPVCVMKDGKEYLVVLRADAFFGLKERIHYFEAAYAAERALQGKDCTPAENLEAEFKARYCI